jgi:ribonuclease T1
MLQGVFSMKADGVIRSGLRRSGFSGLSLWQWGLLWLFCVSALLATAPAIAYDNTTGTLSTVQRSDLPVQGRDVLSRIEQGGPFAFDKDGVVFGNRERLLPRQKRGYYREYTVPTPGIGHRGAKRIVCGGPQPKRPDACYYSADHYASFRLITR